MDLTAKGALAALDDLRLRIADEIGTLRDSPNPERFADDIAMLKRTAAQLQNLGSDLNTLRQRAVDRANEILGEK